MQDKVRTSDGSKSTEIIEKETADGGQVSEEGDLAPTTIKSAATKRRMLIVDDNQVNRLMLANIFKDTYIVDTAVDGATALMRLRHYGASVAVVLLDLVMPGMSGFEVLEKMRSSVEMKSIPVIVVSGQDERENSLRALKAGASDFVTKPVDPSLIRLRVDSAISKAESDRLRAQNSYLLVQSSEEAKYRIVLDSTGTVVIEYDWVAGVFTYDPSITAHLAGKFDKRRLWHILLSDMVADALDVKAMQELVHDVANDRLRGDAGMLVRLKTPSGKKQWFRMGIFKRTDEFQLTDKMIITYANVNDEVLTEEKLRFQAERDILTGLYNRTVFFEKAAEKIAAHDPGYYVMACFDIDNFKVINDQYGSEKGDEVLKQVAEVFRSGFEPVGGLACRIMADNFAVLYPASFITSGKLVTIREAAAVLDGSLPPISFSIGRYIVDDLSLSASAMYDRATLARSSIKGRFDTNIAQYDESMRRRLLREQEIVNEMGKALAEGQFETWLQPQYNHSSGALIGAEALVRWRHPVKGIVSPGEFIPVFERNGFIYEMDKYVWEQICALLRRWIGEGRSPLPVSVNVSRNDLFQEDLLGVITGLVRRYEIPMELLRLEITESAFAKSTDRIISVVRSLIDCGFTVEIDDFGSGYSSLNTLKDVPAQIVKLDMRFLESSENSNRGGNILESIVRMARWLGMAVIAEGVEEREQADYLKSLGCNYVQGYLYARPMPATEYETLVQGAGKEQKLLTLETVENLDNNAFWDPKSMDTLIFNSYVGGACIFEYQNGKIELLRATDKYARVIGGAGMTVEDTLKLDLGKHLDEENTLLVGDALRRSIETKEEVTGEFVFLDLPGCPGKTHLRSTLRVIASAGNRYLVYCTSENITAQRNAEQRARETAERMQAVMDNVNSGITAVIAQGGEVKFLFANDRYYEMLGYTREQYKKEVQNTFDLIHPADRQRILEAVEDINATGRSATLEYRVIRRDGRMIWERNIITVASFSNIDAPVQMAVSTDITKERTALEQLKVLTNSIPGGLATYEVSPEGIKITYFNDGFCNMMGYTREEYAEITATGVMNITFAEDIPGLTAQIDALVRDGTPLDFTYRIHTRDGGFKWVNSRASLGERRGAVCSINVVLLDVTEATLAREAARIHEEEQYRKFELEQRRPSLGEENLIAHALFNLTTGEILDYAYPDGSPVPQADRTALGHGGANAETLIIDPEERRRYKELNDQTGLLARFERGETEFTIDYRRRVPDGNINWTRNIMRLLRQPGGSDILLFDYFYNIEEEKTLELLNHSLISMNYDFVARINGTTRNYVILGDPDKPIATPAMRGEDIDAVSREMAEKHVHPDDREMALRNTLVEGIKKNLERTEPFRFTYREMQPDGSVRYKKLTQYYLDKKRDIIIAAREDVPAFVQEEKR